MTFELDAKALAAARASDVLAIDTRALGSTLALRAERPPSYGSSETYGEQRVACVEVFGPIAQRGDTLCGFYDGYDTIAERLEGALADSNIDAVVLVIDSPGGDVAGLVEGVRRMQAMVAEAGKPCFAYADELAASAAYGVAMVADSGVYLPASGQVGSIGTVMVHIDESGALEGAGVKATIVRSGPQKFTASSLEPLSAEARAKMQARVDMTAALWAGVVAERRGGTAASWLALEGAVFSGAEAVKVGLADGVASLDQVMAMAAAAAEEKGPSMAAAIDKSTVDVNALEVGKIAMALTGSADAEGAIKTLRAWQADSVLAQERAAADAKAAEEAEAKERVELVRGLVLRGMDPAKAWISGEKGPQPENGVHPDWAGMKLKNLRAFAAAMPTAPRQIEAKADPTGGGTIAMTPDIEKQAKAHGIKAEHIASSRALALNGSGTKEI